LTSALYIDNVAFIVTVEAETENIATIVHALPDDPFVMGMVLVDVARTYAKSFQARDDSDTEHEYLKRIREGFEAEWESPTTEISLKEEKLP